MGQLINPTNIRQKVGFLIFRKETGRHGELQKGLDRPWLSGNPSSPPAPAFMAVGSIFLLLRHIFIWWDSRAALRALTPPARLSLEKQRKYDT